MSTRALIGLAVALVILVGLAVLGHRGNAPTELGTGALFLPGLEAKLNDIDRVEVVRGGKEPVATLIRKQDGWAVAERDDYPADISKVRAVLLDLAQAHIVEQKTSNSEYYSRLGVESVDDAKAAGVQLTLRSGDTTLAGVTIGKDAGNSYRYVRRNDGAESYLVDKRIDVPREAAKWVVPDVVDVRGERVRQVTIERPGGDTLVIGKLTPEQPNFTVENVPKGRELQYPGVANVTGGALRELRLEDVAAAKEGTSPAVTATYRTFDGLVVTVEGTEEGDARWIELEASVDEAQAKLAAAKAAKAASSTPAEPAKAGDVTVQEGSASAGSAAAAAASGSAPKAAGKGETGSASEDKAGAERTGKSSAPDPKAEADRINARVHGWRYRIASYQYDQMTRRMEDLLKAEAKPAKAEAKK